MTPPATRPAAPAEPILSDARRAVAEVLRDPLLGAVCFAILTLPIEVSGRLFPTWSEVLGVVRQLGYQKLDA